MNQYDHFTDEEIEQELSNTKKALSDEAARIRSVTWKFTLSFAVVLVGGFLLVKFGYNWWQIIGIALVILAFATISKTWQSDSEKSGYYWSLTQQYYDLENQKKYSNSKKSR